MIKLLYGYMALWSPLKEPTKGCTIGGALRPSTMVMLKEYFNSLNHCTAMLKVTWRREVLNSFNTVEA
jgi:hypothetical protein